MKKIDWNRINNVVTVLAIFYLIFVVFTYFSMVVVDGLREALDNGCLEGGTAFWAMVSIVIVLINCCLRMAIIQTKKATKKNKKVSNKDKEVTTEKKPSTKTTNKQ